MANYPSAQERLQIITRRKELMQELISILVKEEKDREILRLSKKYGSEEVQRMMEHIRTYTQIGNIENDEAILYEEYVNDYRRFGGNRPFLDFHTFNKLNFEFTELLGGQLIGGPLSQEKKERLGEIEDLMLKGSIFWEDITPEAPPVTMPEVDIPEYQTSKSPEKVRLAQGDVPACRRDGFPTLRIGGRLECVVEYLDRCIGQEEIVDLIKRWGTIYFVFANGHKLPFLCGCCNGPLEFRDFEKMRGDITQRRLEYMSMARTAMDDGREFEELVLGFSKKGFPPQGIELSVAFGVAVKMEHPFQCPYKDRWGAKRSGKKKRHSRKKPRKR